MAWDQRPDRRKGLPFNSHPKFLAILAQNGLNNRDISVPYMVPV